MMGTTRRSIRVGWLACLIGLLVTAGGCNAPGGAVAMDQSADDEDIWAIRCRTLKGTDRFQLAENYATALKKVDGIKPDLVQVFHEDDESAVYYGRYRRRYDASGSTESFRPDHLRDLNVIRHLSVNVADPALGSRIAWPFRNATMDTLPTGRGRHPEWHLSKAPGYWSLQVAVFYNTEGMRQRKYAAEEYCKMLRESGEEAYYHHGAVNSSVCIGAFAKEAIQEFREEDSLTGALRVRLKMVDEGLLALQRRFPYNLHNGHRLYETLRDRRTGKDYRDPHTSFAVEIPRPEPGADAFRP